MAELLGASMERSVVVAQRIAAVAPRKTVLAVARPTASSSIAVETAHVVQSDTSCKQAMPRRCCVRCSAEKAEHVGGRKWSRRYQKITRVHGDRLCGGCTRECREMFRQYIPAPPQKPACYLLMRTREEDTVSFL